MKIYLACNFFIELTKLYMVVVLLLKNKISSYKNFYISVLIGMLVDFFCIYMGVQYTAIIVGIIVILIISFNIKMDNGPVIRKYFLVLIMYWVIGIIDVLIAALIMYMTGVQLRQITDDNLRLLIVNSSSIILYIIVIFIQLIVRTYKKKTYKINLVSLKGLIIILFIIINLGVYIAPLEIIGFSESSVRWKKLVVLAASFLSVCFIVLVFQYYIQRAEKQQLKKEMYFNNKIYKSKENYYRMLTHKNMQTIEFRHDLKNHLFCMQVLLQDQKLDELSQYFNDLIGKIQKTKSINVGNELVNAIIVDELGEDNNIKFTVKGMIPELINMRNIDLCTIFSNIIKNAVEAQANVTADKWIRLDISVYNTYIKIVLENAVNSDIEIEDNQLKTSKKDKDNHGIGSRNVLNCIKQYNGNVSYNCKDNIFRCEIIIPNVIDI